MKKLITIFYCISILASGVAQPDKIEKEIFDNINKIRVELKSKSIGRDTLFSHHGLGKLIHLNSEYMNKDSLRKLLRRILIYDYNVEFLDYNVKDPKEITKTNIKKNNPRLYELLKDSTFNRIDMSYDKTGDGYLAHILFRKNIIDIKAHFYIQLPHDLSREKQSQKTHLVINGNTSQKQVYYCKEPDLSKVRQNKVYGSEMILITPDTNGYFEIDIEGHDDFVMFCDRENNLLSLYYNF